MPQADPNSCVGALCRLGLQALGWVYSAAGKRGGGGLRRLDGELCRHRREALEEGEGCPVVFWGEKVQGAASRWDKVKLLPQELPRNGSGLYQERASRVPIWDIPSASSWFLVSKINPAGKPHIFP